MNDRRIGKDARTRPPRRVRIKLHAALPAWAFWSIAAVITVAIASLAWFLDRDDPVPDWISAGLVPALGWIYLALLVIAGVFVLRRRRASGKEKEDGKR